MAEITHSNGCCGLNEITGVSHSTPRDTMLEAARVHYEESDAVAIYLFTGKDKVDNCEEFAQFIKDHKLGSVTKTRAKKNPNSGNKIRGWLWAVNEPEFRVWARKNSINVPHKEGCNCRECDPSNY